MFESETGNESTTVAELCVRAEGGLGLCVWTPNNELSCESVDRNVGKISQTTLWHCAELNTQIPTQNGLVLRRITKMPTCTNTKESIVLLIKF